MYRIDSKFHVGDIVIASKKLTTVGGGYFPKGHKFQITRIAATNSFFKRNAMNITVVDNDGDWMHGLYDRDLILVEKSKYDN